MTKEEFLQKVDKLIPDLNEFIREKAEQITKSGAIEFSDYENDYFLAKVFLCAVSDELETQYRPLTKEGIRIKNYLLHFM